MGNEKDKETVTFPEVSEYQARIDAAKKKTVPLGGAPMPQMPRFDQVNDRYQGIQQQNASMYKALTPEQIAEMQARGQYVPGVGSNYAANQPGAQRAMAKGQEAPPVPATPPGQFANPPRGEGAGLSEKTAEGLAALAAANNPNPPKPTAAEVDKGIAEVVAAVDEVDDEFEIDDFGNKVRNLFANKERKEKIEARCEPMSLEDLLVNQEVTQRVPIVPGKFEPTYRSMQGSEDLFVKRRMSAERGSNQYILDKYALMNLVMSLKSINGRPFPDHLDQGRDPTDALFDAKYKMIMKYPIALLADLSVNFTWFDNRVKKLMVVDDIKGF